MKILLVEDNPDDLLLARLELESLGHQVVAAVDGHAALRLLAAEHPDIVVTDINLPDMDGFAVTRAVQQYAAPNWQPVLFLSGHRNDDLQLRALRTGADGYVVKPVSAEMLGARLEVIERLLHMQRQTEERARELEKYRVAEEEEKRIAEHLIGRMVSADQLADPSVQHWMSAAAFFSGDLVAAARTPGNTLHVLLADACGHGLAASVSVLPILAPFYRMTEKGFGIDAIVREMNAKMREFLPPNRFVAATLAAADFREGYVRVWNGGNPSPFMLSSGAATEVFALRHLPLGVLADEELDTVTETRAFGVDSQLFLYSDGLIEAENAAGEALGFAGLTTALTNAPADARFAAAVAAVRAHMGGAASRDDVSIVAVDCRREDVRVDASLPAPTPAGTPPADPGSWRFGLRLGAAELRRLDVVPLLLGLINQFDGARERSGELFVIMSELFNNALDHGLLRLDSSEKLHAEGMERYLDLRQERLAALDSGDIEIEIEQFGLAGAAWLRIVCRDTGPGFDHAALLAALPAAGDLPFGRGLSLVRKLAASFELNDAGNAATAILAASSPGAPQNPPF